MTVQLDDPLAPAKCDSVMVERRGGEVCFHLGGDPFYTPLDICYRGEMTQQSADDRWERYLPIANGHRPVYVVAGNSLQPKPS